MTSTKAVYLLVVDGFADWEPAHAVAELRRHGGYRVETAGFTLEELDVLDARNRARWASMFRNATFGAQDA